MKNIKNYITAVLLIGGLSLGILNANPATTATATVAEAATKKIVQEAAKKAAETAQIINFSELSKRTGELAKAGLSWAASNWRISIPAVIAGSLYTYYAYEASVKNAENKLNSNTAIVTHLDELLLIPDTQPLLPGVKESIKFIANAMIERYDTPSYSIVRWFMSKCFPSRCVEHPRVTLAKQLQAARSIADAKRYAEQLKRSLIASN